MGIDRCGAPSYETAVITRTNFCRADGKAPDTWRFLGVVATLLVKWAVVDYEALGWGFRVERFAWAAVQLLGDVFEVFGAEESRSAPLGKY